MSKTSEPKRRTHPDGSECDGSCEELGIGKHPEPTAEQIQAAVTAALAEATSAVRASIKAVNAIMKGAPNGWNSREADFRIAAEMLADSTALSLVSLGALAKAAGAETDNLPQPTEADPLPRALIARAGAKVIAEIIIPAMLAGGEIGFTGPRRKADDRKDDGPGIFPGFLGKGPIPEC